MLSTIDRFVRDQRFETTLATLQEVEGKQLVAQWGTPASNLDKVGVTWANYIGRIIIVHSDDSEESYPFAIITRETDQREGKKLEEIVPKIPALMGPDAFKSAEEWQ